MSAASRLVCALRSALYLAFLIVTVVPWAVVVLLASMAWRGPRLYWLAVQWLRASTWGALVICGVRAQVRGLENVPTAQDARSAVLLAPKHQSTWETFFFPTLMPHPLAYVFKRELLRIPFFGWAMGRLDMVHIDRSRRTEAWSKVAEQGRRLFSEGVWVIMFPEGTRTPRGEQGVYKTGASRLAIATGVPIVPIAVASARCWPRKSFLLRPGVIPVSIGRPIPSQGRDPEELMREVEAWIEAEMRRLDPEAYPGSTHQAHRP
ncbi:MAG: lysophospholipid acyltransferase family protein [Rubrivivax sp.]